LIVLAASSMSPAALAIAARSCADSPDTVHLHVIDAYVRYHSVASPPPTGRTIGNDDTP
jgi:hypothetical protein